MKPFLELPPHLCNPATARCQILPVPYEGTVCFLGGTARGPEAILAVSDQMEHFDEEQRVDFSQHGIATLPPVKPATTPEEQQEAVYAAVRRHDLFRSDRFPIILGGEHGITPAVVRRAVECYDSVSVLQFDAHADLRDSYTGGRFSHASAMRRVLDYTPNLVQVGIRSFSAEEYGDHAERINQIITPKMLEQTFQAGLDQILAGLTSNVYITLDIDVFDPAFAPGTGTPEPGGLSWPQVTGILKEVFATKRVIGADVVEVAPRGEHDIVTEFLAARLVGKMIAYDFASSIMCSEELCCESNKTSTFPEKYRIFKIIYFT